MPFTTRMICVRNYLYKRMMTKRMTTRMIIRIMNKDFLTYIRYSTKVMCVKVYPIVSVDTNTKICITY
jgi:hypothetical protein